MIELVSVVCAECGAPEDVDGKLCPTCTAARDARWSLGGMEPFEGAEIVREHILDSILRLRGGPNAFRFDLLGRLFEHFKEWHPEIERIESERDVFKDVLVIRVKLYDRPFAETLILSEELLQ